MTTVIMVRHGESRANDLGVFAGHEDIDLTEKGFLQAKLTAKALTEKFNIDKIYSSDLKRAYHTGLETARILNIDIEKSANLREIMAGDWGNVSFDELTINFKEDYNIWLNDIGNARCTGGESVKELADRIYSKVLSIAEENENKTVLITTHATPIRAMMCYVNKLPVSEMAKIPWVSNASYTVFEYDKEGFSLIEADQYEHLKDVSTSLPKNV